jgi:hydrogenase maturation protein HypF
MCLALRARHGCGTVALSGGVFQNRLVLEGMLRRLAGEGFTVLAQRQLPANDGGIALGQAVIASAALFGA